MKFFWILISLGFFGWFFSAPRFSNNQFFKLSRRAAMTAYARFHLSKCTWWLNRTVMVPGPSGFLLATNPFRKNLDVMDSLILWFHGCTNLQKASKPPQQNSTDITLIRLYRSAYLRNWTYTTCMVFCPRLAGAPHFDAHVHDDDSWTGRLKSCFTWV